MKERENHLLTDTILITVASKSIRILAESQKYSSTRHLITKQRNSNLQRRNPADTALITKWSRSTSAALRHINIIYSPTGCTDKGRASLLEHFCKKCMPWGNFRQTQSWGGTFYKGLARILQKCWGHERETILNWRRLKGHAS